MTPAPRCTLDQLLVLDAIARCGSFAGAARELHRVPSAVSYAVQAMEEGLGVALFDRSGHRAGLTAAGRQLLEEARDLLDRARRLDRLAARLGDGWEPELRIVADGAWALDPLLRAVRRLSDDRVPTQIRVDVEYQDGVIDRFHQERADLMIALGLEDGGHLKGVPLAPLEMILVAARAHPLALRCRLSRDDLADHVDLVVQDSSPRFAATPRRSFLGTRRVLRLSDFHAKRAALLAGIGFGWMPLHLVRADLDADALRPLDLPDGNRWSYRPQLITRRDDPPGRAARLVMEEILRG